MEWALCDGNYLTCRSVYAGAKLCIQVSGDSEIYQQYKDYTLPITEFVAKNEKEEKFIAQLELVDPGKGFSHVLPTGGPYLFLKGLQTFYAFGKLAVVFDGGHSPFRTSLFPDYKKKAPKDVEMTIMDKVAEKSFKLSFDLIPQLLSKMSIPNFRMKGEEADDVLYHVSKYLVEAGHAVTAVSDDEDFLQFLNFGANIYRPRKEELVDHQVFVDKYGFSPHFLPLYKAIIGDPSDSIPGVYRVGKVGSTKIIKLVEESNSEKDVIESLIDCIGSIKKKNAAQKKVLESFKIVKRNLLLIDIARNSVCQEKAPKMVGLFNQANKDLIPDVKSLINTFRVLKYTSLSEILIQFGLIKTGLA